jgi:hypothetical protein
MLRLKKLKADRVHIDQLARKLGLGKVYDLVYRYPSMEVHGRAFRLPSPSEEGGIAPALSAIVSLVSAIGLIADNRVLRDRATAAHEIIHLLRLDGIAGK